MHVPQPRQQESSSTGAEYIHIDPRVLLMVAQIEHWHFVFHRTFHLWFHLLLHWFTLNPSLPGSNLTLAQLTP